MKPYPVPTKDALRTANNKTLPDIIVPGLKILFCGVNPGLYSAAIGHHFGRPGNRFWKALCGAGITLRLLSPYEDATLPSYGCGITNIVPRATAGAAELKQKELVAGRGVLAKKVRRYRPKVLAVLGIDAYRRAFEKPSAGLGGQQETIGTTRVWVLPNPSGLNARYQLNDLVGMLRKLKVRSSGR